MVSYGFSWGVVYIVLCGVLVIGRHDGFNDLDLENLDVVNFGFIQNIQFIEERNLE